jgi:hypothetical protein
VEHELTEEIMRGIGARTALVVAGAASVVLLAGCGSSSPTTAAAGASSAPAGNGMDKLTANEILKQAQAAASAATSVHVAGKAAALSIDLEIGAASADGKVGTDGDMVEVVRVGGVYYLKADKAFWTKNTNAKAATLLADKYVKVDAAQVDEYKAFTNMSDFFTGALKASGTVTKGSVTTVDGQRAITLKDSSDGSLLFIALDGSPLPIKTQNSGADGGDVTFTGWNAPVTVAAPAASQVIDLAALAAAG